MREDQARAVELVRALELEDRDATLLTPEDRSQADAAARSASSALKGRQFEQGFIAARADFAASRLVTRHPGLRRLLTGSQWPTRAALLVPLGALAAGFLANEFGTDKRLDLLAVPLIGTIAWNLIVYLWIALTALLWGSGHSPASSALTGLAGRAQGEAKAVTVVERAAAAFRVRWAQVTASLTAARVSRTLHLAAALFAAGLIGGIYLRALVIEYRAGWESTFLAPSSVRAILSLLLGPASYLTGVPIPPTPEISAMRWTGRQTGGVNAAPWIHLYTATLLAVVVFPRLALAAWQALRSLRLAKNLRVANRDDFYVRRLLRASGAAPGRVRVTPYAYAPGDEVRGKVTSLLRAVLGDGAQVRFDEPVVYGMEDEWFTEHAVDPRDDYHLMLFTLSSTPEAENHGEFARLVRNGASNLAAGTMVGALLDETPFRAHFAGQPGVDHRVETRISAWRAILSPAGISTTGLDLEDRDEDGLAKRLESNLMREADLSR